MYPLNLYKNNYRRKYIFGMYILPMYTNEARMAKK